MPAVVRGGRRQSGPARNAAPRRSARPARPPGRGPAVGVGALSPDLVASLTVGLLALVLLVVGLGGWGGALVSAVGGGLNSALGAAGFELRRVHIQGASEASRRAIQAALPLERGQPLAGLDLQAVRSMVEQVAWVEEARVVRLLPDTLIISVVERRPLAVWQSAGQTVVVDANGTVIRGADPGLYPELPLIVGAGAEAAAADLIPRLAAWPRLNQRIEAIVRVDERRWDLRMKNGSLIQLPATGEDAALIQLEAMDQDQRLLDLGFERIDLRVAEAVVVRRRAAA